MVSEDIINNPNIQSLKESLGVSFDLKRVEHLFWLDEAENLAYLHFVFGQDKPLKNLFGDSSSTLDVYKYLVDNRGAIRNINRFVQELNREAKKRGHKGISYPTFYEASKYLVRKGICDWFLAEGTKVLMFSKRHTVRVKNATWK